VQFVPLEWGNIVSTHKAHFMPSIPWRVKTWNKEPRNVKIMFKNCKVATFKNRHVNTVIWKISFLFLKNYILYKVSIKKFHTKSLFFKSPFTCLTHSKKTCGQVFFFLNFFSLSKMHQSCLILLNTLMFMIRRLLGIEIGENIVFDAFMHIWFKCAYVNSKVWNL